MADYLENQDVMKNLDFLKDALTAHFMCVQGGDTYLGGDHADILKRHIDQLVAGKKWLMVSASEAEPDLDPWAMLPKAISRSAVNVTLDWGEKDLGVLGSLPREIRDMIYQYTFSVDCDAVPRTCSKDDYRATSGLGLLRVGKRIYEEAVPLLYAAHIFLIKLGFKDAEWGAGQVQWNDPTIWCRSQLGYKLINNLPMNAFRLIQNLEIDFENETLLHDSPETWSFIECHTKLLSHMGKLCTVLRDSEQLHRLDINLSFACSFSDIKYMTSLLEPIKLLRGIKDPSITVHGFQHIPGGPDRIERFQRPWRYPNSEPRWHLHEEYESYLEALLMSPHGSESLPDDDMFPFYDSFAFQDAEITDDSEADMNMSSHSQTHDDWKYDPNITDYMRDVYGTDDIEALHGGMPARWQNFLNHDLENSCDWFDAD